MAWSIITCHRTHNFSFALCHTLKNNYLNQHVYQKQSDNILLSYHHWYFFCHTEELRPKSCYNIKTIIFTQFKMLNIPMSHFLREYKKNISVFFA